LSANPLMEVLALETYDLVEKIADIHIHTYHIANRVASKLRMKGLKKQSSIRTQIFCFYGERDDH
jgi:hypothetical protein